MFSKSDSWGYSIVVGLKYTSRYTRLLGLQEFQVSRIVKEEEESEDDEMWVMSRVLSTCRRTFAGK